jgi:hypothetical protein
VVTICTTLRNIKKFQTVNALFRRSSYDIQRLFTEILTGRSDNAKGALLLWRNFIFICNLHYFLSFQFLSSNCRLNGSQPEIQVSWNIISFSVSFGITILIILRVHTSGRTIENIWSSLVIRITLNKCTARDVTDILIQQSLGNPDFMDERMALITRESGLSAETSVPSAT